MSHFHKTIVDPADLYENPITHHKIAEDVYLLPYKEGVNQPGHEHIQKYEKTRPYHKCREQGWLTEMVFRDNNEGPMYWCIGCGHTLDEGVSMAIRLNEVEIS